MPFHPRYAARILSLVAGGMLAAAALAQQPNALPGSEECVACHDTGQRTGKREKGMPPPFDAAALRASPHAALECAACHSELAKKEFPHSGLRGTTSTPLKIQL